MATGQLNKFLTHLRNVMVLQDGRNLSDAELVRRYVQERDEAAFELLVRKHGPMVLGVCRRILRNPHDAEDAFQATWLVLVRKAATLRSPGTVGNWLYGVAYRTALEARKLAAKRRNKEAKVTLSSETAPDAWDKLRPVLDHELERLPDKYRAVVVLCDLEGKTRKEAARLLGLPEGTVTSRLATGRRTLARRLSRHRLAITAMSLATLLSRNALAGVPTSLVSCSVRAARLVAAGQAAGQISAPVIALTEGVLRTMLLTKLKITTTWAFLAVLIAGGIGVSVHRTWAACAVEANGPAVVQAKPERGKERLVTDPANAAKPHVMEQPLRAGPPRVLVKYKSPVTCLGWSPDGRWVAASTQDGTIHVTEAAAGKEIRSFPIQGAATALAFSPDGKRLALSQPGQPSGIWIVDTGKEQPNAGRAGGNFAPAAQVAFTPDGQSAVSVAVGQIVRAGATGGSGMMGTPGGSCAAIAADGTACGWCDAKGMLRIFQPDNPILRPVNMIPVGSARCIAIAPGGKLLAVGASDNSIQLWDWTVSKKTLALPGLEKPASKLSFSADGRTLAALTADGLTIQVWDPIRGSPRCTINHVSSGAEWLALSPDGKMLATTSKGGKEIFLWKVTARLMTPSGAPLQLTEREFTSLWGELGSPDAGKGDVAWRKLAAAGDNSIPFLRQRIRTIAVPSAELKPIEKLVSELDSAQFTIREQAMKKLLATGELAIVPLQRHLEKGLSVEASRRVQQVLDKLGQPVLTPDRVLALQAIELLEALQTAKAVALLEETVRDALVPQIRSEARQALQRLRKVKKESN
jgi:RNA polymerase sigma factor (sigma-70 family)